ncbi:MAG: hypothetical protein V3R25_09185 [Nitrosomonadaceae bacterium]
MICEKCGTNLGSGPKKDPWCMYKAENGQVINAMFHPDSIPEGWYDSPKAAKAALVPKEEKVEEPKQKRTRRTRKQMQAEKVNDNGDSAGNG